MACIGNLNPSIVTGAWHGTLIEEDSPVGLLSHAADVGVDETDAIDDDRAAERGADVVLVTVVGSGHLIHSHRQGAVVVVDGLLGQSLVVRLVLLPVDCSDD